MKFKRTVIFSIFVVTLGLLLGTSAAQETRVIFEEDTTKAIGIENNDDLNVWAKFTEAVPPGQIIGGSVSGIIEGGVLDLQNNGADDLEVTANGTFTFATPLSSGDTYDVTVLTNPEGLTCTVVNGSGTALDANVTDVEVTCGDSGPVEVPAVEGQPLADAVAAIEADGLTVGNVTPVFSDSEPAGTVVGQAPPP